MALRELSDLYMEQIQDLYSAEQQILEALPKMMDGCSHGELRDGFSEHEGETQDQVQRLAEIAQRLGITLGEKTCEGMKGLLKEGADILKDDGNPDVIDAALLAAAQRVEHYEIAAYGCARTYAQALGRSDDARLLQQTLDEEGKTDKKLTRMAERIVNPDAMSDGLSVRRGPSTWRREPPTPGSEARP